jgi:hypothetical protein
MPNDVLVIPPKNAKDARKRIVAARSETARRRKAAQEPAQEPPLDLTSIKVPTTDRPAQTPAVRLTVAHLNYPGNLRIDPDRALGPNQMGERLYPVEASYDPDADKTRVGLSYIAPAPATS